MDQTMTEAECRLLPLAVFKKDGPDKCCKNHPDDSTKSWGGGNLSDVTISVDGQERSAGECDTCGQLHRFEE